MVLLTMTPAIVAALQKVEDASDSQTTEKDTEDQATRREQDAEPSLFNPAAGKPISHGQVIDLSRKLKSKGVEPCHLDILLRGSRIFIPPPPPKPEPTPEYKALMARLRREEEARAYERMLNPPAPMETFAQRFPTSSAAYAFASTAAYSPAIPEDDVTYEDISRQTTLIFNVLISIFACAAAIWMAARWWDTPARLALSMSGSLLVGVAEVVVYSGYLRRLSEAKKKEAKVQEVKEIVKTWVVGEDPVEENGESKTDVLLEQKHEGNPAIRKRRKDKT